MTRKPTVSKTTNHSDSDQTVPPSQRGRHHNLRVLPSAPHSAMQDGILDIYTNIRVSPLLDPPERQLPQLPRFHGDFLEYGCGFDVEPDNQLRLLLVLFYWLGITGLLHRLRRVSGRRGCCHGVSQVCNKLLAAHDVEVVQKSGAEVDLENWDHGVGKKGT